MAMVSKGKLKLRRLNKLMCLQFVWLLYVIQLISLHIALLPNRFHIFVTFKINLRWFSSFATVHPSLRITRWQPWKRASAGTRLKWPQSKRNVIGIFHSCRFFSGSNCWVAELNFLTEVFDSGRWAEPLSSLSHCVLIASSRCKFHKIEFFNAFFHLPRKVPLWNWPQSSIKIHKKCRWCALPAALQWPLFFFIIFIITILPFNGNSMTSGEGSCITHC